MSSLNARILRDSLAFFALSACVLVGQASAQETYRARLSPMPVNQQTVRTITGVGDVRFTLSGNRLTVSGEFRGMSSPATSAHLHLAAPTMAGPVSAPLQFTAAPEGQISGTVTLNAEQLAALRGHSLYVQVHSQGNPSGELRGWVYDTDIIGEVAANLEPRSLTVEDLMRDFVPVTDAMLRNPDPADWPMMRGNYS